MPYVFSENIQLRLRGFGVPFFFPLDLRLFLDNDSARSLSSSHSLPFLPVLIFVFYSRTCLDRSEILQVDVYVDI